MSTLDDLKTYLGEADSSQWSDAELSGAITTEAAAQRHRIRASVEDPADVPDLYEALMRRCARNLAMRKHPLGIAMSAGGEEATRVGGRDPEVLRLEAPYRRLVVG